MYARITSNQFPPDQLDAAVQFLRERGLQELQGQQGFQGLYILVDRAGGNAMAISLWETEADLQASEERAAVVRGQTGETGGAKGAGMVERYEVVLQP